MAVARLIVMSVPLIGTPEIPRVNQLALDWRVLTFAVATAAASVCVFGIVPALFATGRLRPVLGSGRCVEGPRRRTTSNLLIAVQIAGALVLLVASALALTSLYRLHNVDMGFNTRQLTVTTIRPSTTTLQQPGDLRFYDRVLDGLRTQPGVESVATISHVPLEPALAAAASVTTGKGVVLPEGRNGPRVRVMSPAALQTLGVPILHGRDFLPADRNGAPLVTIVNDTLAHRLWGDRDAIGNSLLIESRGRKRTYGVVGVARDFRASLRRVPQPEAYLAAAQEPSRLKVVVRSALPPDVVAARIRAVVSSEDPDVPITAVSTVTGLVRSGAAYTRFHAVLLAAFGVVGALLASMGILAVVASTVAYRTREIGVRIAIGATPHHVVTLMAREMTVPVVGGLAAGLLGIYNLASLLQQRGVLFEVNQFEPGLYTVVTLALSVLAIAAAWLPARRAARVQPMVALRSE
jgi:putative ABC transport system permease protein